jgi:hypothetical protein
MRKILVMLLFLPTLGFAQFTQGGKLVTGNASHSRVVYNSIYDTRWNTSIFNLGTGFFVSESFVIGPLLEFTRQHSKQNFTNRISSSAKGGVFVRKFYPLSEKFFIALDGNVLAGVSSENDKIQKNKNSEFTYSVSFTPMLTYLPSKKLGFNATFGGLSYNRNNLDKTSIFIASLGQVGLGLNYFIGH